MIWREKPLFLETPISFLKNGGHLSKTFSRYFFPGKMLPVQGPYLKGNESSEPTIKFKGKTPQFSGGINLIFCHFKKKTRHHDLGMKLHPKTSER